MIVNQWQIRYRPANNKVQISGRVHPPMNMPTPSRLDRLLRPRSVAIVGISPEPGHPGGSVLANLERSGFEGSIHLVSRTRKEFGGRPCVASIDDLPEGVDVAVLVIPQ